jgi:hypothetical protein
MNKMSEVNRKAWVYKKAGKTWSESMKAAWSDVYFTGLDFTMSEAPKAEPRKVPQVPPAWADGDVIAYRESLKRYLGIPA